MVNRKKTTKKAPAKRAAQTRAVAYRIEQGIEKPTTTLNGKSLERVTLEKLKVGQSFAVSDQSRRKRLSDICYRIKRETSKIFSVRKMEHGLRVWRDK